MLSQDKHNCLLPPIKSIFHKSIKFRKNTKYGIMCFYTTVCPVKVGKVSNSKKLQVQEILECEEMKWTCKFVLKLQGRRLVNVEIS